MSTQNDPSANQLSDAEAGLRAAVDSFIGSAHSIILSLQNAQNTDTPPESAQQQTEREQDPDAFAAPSDKVSAFDNLPEVDTE